LVAHVNIAIKQGIRHTNVLRRRPPITEVRAKPTNKVNRASFKENVTVAEDQVTRP
jgi:hypothetical protein